MCSELNQEQKGQREASLQCNATGEMAAVIGNRCRYLRHIPAAAIGSILLHTQQSLNPDIALQDWPVRRNQ